MTEGLGAVVVVDVRGTEIGAGAAAGTVVVSFAGVGAGGGTGALCEDDIFRTAWLGFAI